MSFLGKFTPNVISASNENTLAFIAPKTEFSLIKVEAPIEFGPLGSALSRPRKRYAEEGVPHQTARRLGALFEQIIPPTPKLISAYGRRVSEIIKSPGINPEGLTNDGPFRDCVGADATAMWAAATSGIAAIAMYMLASFIARAFNETEAISLWVELVDERKKQICTQVSQNTILSEASLYGAQQDIPRRDLALWDNSARSWLRSADENKLDKIVQLRLIVENLNIPHYSTGSTYKNIVDSWTEAMIGIEELLNGKPQEAQNKSVPLGLQSWHLYPNLIVLSKKTKHISFSDSLFVSSATLTLGIASQSNEYQTGSKWSLALSHYQYYGGAVSVQSEEDSSRVTLQQALVVTLGALWGTWGFETCTTLEMIQAANWIKDIFLQLTNGVISVEDWIKYPPRHFEWLAPLFESAEMILQTKDIKETKLLLQLFRLGQRRHNSFLIRNSKGIPPFFGLCNKLIAGSLCQDSFEECNVQYLRSLASHLKLASHDCIIYHRRSRHEWEIMTALPVRFVSDITKVDEEPKKPYGHIRWVNVFDPALFNLNDFSLSSLTLSQQKEGFPKHYHKALYKRCEQIKKLGEKTRLDFRGAFRPCQGAEPFQLFWRSPPSEFLHGRRFSLPDSILTFELLEGDQTIGLLTTTLHSNYRSFDSNEKRKTRDLKQLTVNIGDSRDLIHAMNSSSLETFLLMASSGEVPRSRKESLFSRFRTSLLETPENIISLNLLVPLGNQFNISVEGLNTLNSLAMIQQVYRDLKDPILSTKIFNTGKLLCECQWFKSALGSIGADAKDTLRRTTSILSTISPPIALACVLYMDSGTLDLRVEDLQSAIAISRENNIYVANCILSDPSRDISKSRRLLTRLMGNVGRSGTSVLIAPKQPLIKEAGSNFRVINHEIYDYSRENNFAGSSLHLQFTEWTRPIGQDSKFHTIDHPAQFLETEIKLRDGGNWIADLDIIFMLNTPRSYLENGLKDECLCHRSASTKGHRQVISLDNWEELLDAPKKALCIFRAHGNWSARLAAACILAQLGMAIHTVIVGPGEYCLNCLQNKLTGYHGTVYIID